MRLVLNKIVSGGLLATLLVGQYYVQAADLDSARSLSQLSLEQLLSIKVRSATNTENSLKKAPASISVFTQKQIRRLGVETLDELLVFVPGFQVARGEEGGGSFTFSPRGRRSDSSQNRDILLLIDGSRINEPVTTGAFEQERQIPLYNAKKVEIIRGPGSALYGSNAFLAVVNIETDKTANYMKIGLGSFSQKRAELSISDDHNKDWQFSLSASHYQDDGEDYPAFYEYWGKFEDTSDPGRRSNLDVHFMYKSLEASYRYSDRKYDAFITVGAQLNEFQRQKMTNEILQVKYQLDWDEHKLNLFAERQEGVFDYLTGLFPYNPDPLPSQFGLYWTDGSIDALVGGNYREVTQNRIGLDGIWKINEQHRISYGISSRQEKTSLNPFQGNWNAHLLETTGEYVPSSPDNFIQRGFWIAGERFDLLNPEARNILGAYLQDEWKLNNSWQLTLGGRLDDYEDFGSNLSIRSGLVFTQNGHHWKFLYGEAFRAPSFTETRAGIASGGISNPDLNPEIVKTTEIIYGLNKKDWFFNLTLYHNQFEDMIVNVLVDDVVEGITAVQPQNIGDESGTGIEFEYNMALSDNWHFNFGGDYLLDELAEQHVANKRIFARLNYQKNDFETNLSANYLGEVMARKADGQNLRSDLYLDDYWIVNLNSRWKFSSSILYYAKISNLFDQQYYSFTPQTGLESGLPGRGRSVQVGISYEF